MPEEVITRTARIEVDNIVEDVAREVGLRPDSAAAVEAEIMADGKLRLTLAGNLPEGDEVGGSP